MGSIVCDCGYSHYGDSNLDQHAAWASAEIAKDRAAWEEYCDTVNGLRCLFNNLERAASLAAIYRLGYTKGFSDAELLKAFCEDYVPQPYFPTADNRPTAERLEWPALS